MMKIFKLMTLTIFIMGLLISASWSADDGWKKIGESEGIAGYARPTTRSSIDEIMAVGIVEAPIAVVEAVMRDARMMPEYMFLCKEAEIINTTEMKSEGDILYIYNLTDMPFPVSDRDAVVRNVWSIDKSTGIIYSRAETVKTTYRQNKNVIRMPLSIIKCTLIPESEHKTKVIYQALGDPGGTLPEFLVNILTRDLGIKTIAGIRKVVTRDEFKNIRTVVTKTAKANR
jgi:hypothetical protein